MDRVQIGVLYTTKYISSINGTKSSRKMVKQKRHTWGLLCVKIKTMDLSQNNRKLLVTFIEREWQG